MPKSYKKYTIDIKVGDKIQVGRFRNVTTMVKNITIDEHGQPIIHTNKGKKKLFTCRIHKLTSEQKLKTNTFRSKESKKTWFLFEETI